MNAFPHPHKFSFIVSNYNYERYLKECLDSLVEQDYPATHFEIICVDDGSTDNSLALIRTYEKKFSIFKSIAITNSGLEKAVNTGIGYASHPFIIRVDADDVVARNLLKLMDAAMTQYPQFNFYYCQEYSEYYSSVEQIAKTLPPFDKEEIFSRGDFFATATVYRKSDLAEIGGFPEDVKNCGLENYAVILALLSRNKEGCPVSGASFKYRRHPTNMSIVKRQAIIEYGKRLLAQYGRPYRTNQYHPYGLTI